MPLTLDRVAGGREAQPIAAIVDSQTVKASEALAPRDYDANDKLTSLKRHALADVDRRILITGFSTARLHDSVDATALLKAAKIQCPLLELSWADSASRGPVVEAVAVPGRVEIVFGLTGQKGFVVQKRRWLRAQLRVAQPLSPAFARLRSHSGNNLRHDLRRQRFPAHPTHRGETPSVFS